MPELDYRALNRRAHTELKREKTAAHWAFFVVSLMIYLLFLGLGWFFFLESNTQTGVSKQGLSTAGMIMLTIGGGLGVMFQFFSAVIETTGGDAKMRSRIMERLVADEIIRLEEEEEGLDDKAKRMMISDEGELEEIVDEAEMLSEQEQRQMLKK